MGLGIYVKNWRTLFLKRISKKRTEDGLEEAIPIECESQAIKEPKSYNRPESGPEYDPKAGQPGKNVQWVPASYVVIKRMFELAKVTPEDYVIDLGSGDGRIVISAAKLGAQALGIEYNPRLVELSRQNAAKQGVIHRAVFVQADLFMIDFSMATVLPLFLRQDINIKLRPKILDMMPGTRIVSNIFDMGDWRADNAVEVEDKDYYFKNHTIYFWVVPAKAGGTWKLPRGMLTLEQNFQVINGILKSGNGTMPVSGKLVGDRIDFMADSRQFTGRVTKSRMELETDDGRETGWKISPPALP